MASPPPIKAPDSPANTPLPESPTAWLEGGWTMIDPSEAGYSISFEEAEANEDLPVSVVQFIFRPDSSMTRSVDIVYGETVTSNGKWLIYG